MARPIHTVWPNAPEIKVTENPDETGSFFVGLQCERFILSPSGVLAADRLQLTE